jgi:hypothetical protein
MNIWLSYGPLDIKFSWKFLFTGHYITITLQKNLLDLSIFWVFHVLLYCSIYASAFSLIALKIKFKIFNGLTLSISHHLKCPAGGISPIRTVLIFIRPSKDGTYYVMALSVRPSVLPCGRRWSFQFSGLFFAIFAAIGLKLGVLLCSQELLFQFAFRCDWFIFARVMPLELGRISYFFSFPDFFLPSLQV